MSYEDDGYEIMCGAVSSSHIDLLNHVARTRKVEPHISSAHRKLMFVKAMMRLPVLVAKAHECVGGAPVAINSEYFFGHPGTNGFNPHQDNHFIQAPLGTMVSCWVALTDVDETNGGLYVYPGSHQNGLRPIVYEDPSNRVNRCELPHGSIRHAMTMAKGDAIFMHGELIHGSFINMSDRNRESITIAYVQRGVPFRPGRYGRVEIPVT